MEANAAKLKRSSSNPGDISFLYNDKTKKILDKHFSDLLSDKWLQQAYSADGAVVSSFSTEIWAGDGPNGKEENAWYAFIWYNDKHKGLNIRIIRDNAGNKDWFVKVWVGAPGSFGIGASWSMIKHISFSQWKKLDARALVIEVISKYLGV